MYVLTVEETFASAHQLRGYRGKCENLHGHNWKVILSIRGEELNDIGLLVDFGDLKTALRGIIQELDHKNLNDLEYFSRNNPSSENIARYISDEFSKRLPALSPFPLNIESVTVWESNTSRCTYIPS